MDAPFAPEPDPESESAACATERAAAARPRQRTVKNPWGRFCVLWVCCSLASGILPGQALFAKLFADAGVFSSVCGPPESGLRGGGGDERGDPPSSAAHSGRAPRPEGHRDLPGEEEQEEEQEQASGRTPPPTGKTCKAQFVDLTAVFQSGQMIAYSFLAPIGVAYDRWGARTIGTAGAALCALSLLMIWVSLLGAAAGYDATFASVFTVGVLACDFGSMLNSFAFMGLVWHFPGSQALILALVNATYQVSAFLPLAVQAVMHALDIDLSWVMLFYVGVVVLCTYACWRLVPTQQEYYQAAKDALGIPLPKPPKSLAPWQMCRHAWEVLRAHRLDHAVSGLALGLGFCFPGFYGSLAASYGEALFGTKADGTKLAELYVSVTAVVGATIAPLSGKVADAFGLKAFMIFLGLLQFVGLATCGFASWTMQTVCTTAMVLWSTLMTLFISRYFLLYSPPNRFGTVQGLYITFLTLFALPVSGFGLSAAAMMPPGPDAYRIPLYVYGTLGTLGLALYAVYFDLHPPPETPPLLPEDEKELAGNFGCVSFEEVMQVAQISTRRELLRFMADSDPQAMIKLVASIDADRLSEVVAQRPMEDLASMLEGHSDYGEGDSSSSDGDAPAAKRSDGDALAAKRSARCFAAAEKPSGEPVATPLKTAAATPLKTGGGDFVIPMRKRDTCDGCFAHFWKMIPGVRARRLPYAALKTDSDGSSSCNLEDTSEDVEAASSNERIQSVAERLQRLLTTRDKLGVVDYLLQESVNDINAVGLFLEQRMSAAERKRLDKDFSALIPGSEFAKLLRQRPELRTVVQESMKREMQRKFAAMKRRLG